MMAYVLFTLFILFMLGLDLGVFHRHSHTVSIREAVTWSVVWIILSLTFNVLVYFAYERHWFDLGLLADGAVKRGKLAAMEFFTGYVVEKALSVDNIFVFLLIFNYFRVPAQYQHKVLFWGILGALIMRALFIAAGAVLISRFDWILSVFGAFLVYTGFRMLWSKDKQIEPEKNPVLRIFRRFTPVTPAFEGDRFFVRRELRLPATNGSAAAPTRMQRFATPLFVVLLLVETTDVIFAVDSIPAIFGITQDPFIVYTSNIFAILGLRALYFALGGLMTMFHYLHYGLSAVLIFVGGKMLAHSVWKPSMALALGVIVGILALSVTASLMWPRKDEPLPQPPVAP